MPTRRQLLRAAASLAIGPAALGRPASARPTAESARVERGIPTWGSPAAVARPDGSFLIVH